MCEILVWDLYQRKGGHGKWFLCMRSEEMKLKTKKEGSNLPERERESREFHSKYGSEEDEQLNLFISREYPLLYKDIHVVLPSPCEWL